MTPANLVVFLGGAVAVLAGAVVAVGLFAAASIVHDLIRR